MVRSKLGHGRWPVGRAVHHHDSLAKPGCPGICDGGGAGIDAAAVFTEGET